MLGRLNPLCLVLVLGCGGAEEAARPAFTREQLLDPSNCKSCHPKHYAEWSASMHAYATKDPVFQAMNRRGQAETGNTLGPFCLNCHAPMAVRENVIRDYANVDDLPEHLQGVTCYFCHNAVAFGAEHNNAKITLADDTTMRAAIDGAQFPSVHKVKHSSNHDRFQLDSAIMCGTCHDIVNQTGFHLERTLEEYQQSIFSDEAVPMSFQTCQTCHMDASFDEEPAALSSGYPGVSTHLRKSVHEHLFPAVDVPLTPFPGADALRLAIERCKLPASVTYLNVAPKPPGARIQVLLETQAGHGQPSGASQDRRMWLEVVGYDAQGDVVFKEGQIADGQLEETPGQPHPCLMRDYTLDTNGNDSRMFWDAASLDQTRAKPIPPPTPLTAAGHTRTCEFLGLGTSPIPRLDFTLRMRPIGMDVLQDLVASGHLSPDVVDKVPTLTLWTRRVNYDPKTYQYLDDEPDLPLDCATYKCMLSGEGPNCGEGPAAVGGDEVDGG